MRFQSVDTLNISTMFANYHVWWASPMDLAITFGYLCYLVGRAALPALFMMIMLIPINIFLVKKLGNHYGMV